MKTNIHHTRWVESLKEGDLVLIDDGTTRYKATYLGRAGLNHMVDAEYAKVEQVEEWMLFPIIKPKGKGKYPNK